MGWDEVGGVVGCGFLVAWWSFRRKEVRGLGAKTHYFSLIGAPH